MNRSWSNLAACIALLSGASPLCSQLPLEDEVLVNQTVEGSQFYPRVVFDGQSDSLVFWFDNENEITPSIKMRRFAPDGTSTGELTLASPINIREIDGAAHNALGDSILTFGDDNVVKAQRFSRSGERLGSPVSVTGNTGYSSGSADVSVKPDGSFVVAFNSEDQSQIGVQWIITARLFDATGAPASPVLRVMNESARNQIEPWVATDAAGNFAVFWTSTLEANYWQVLLRRFSASGEALGPAFDPTPGGQYPYQYAWDIAMDPAGNFVILWGNGPWADLWARRFGPDGQPKGPAFKVTQYEPTAQYNAAMAMDSAGNFVVVWAVSLQNGEVGEIYGRLFRADGTPASNEFHINQLYGAWEEDRPRVALSEDGVVAVTWQNDDSGDGHGWSVMMRRFLATCPPDATFLPLRGGRFKACVRWETPEGTIGSGTPMPWSDESGGFSFFAPTNLELFVKLLDGCAVNGHYWLYTAGLTDVGVDLAVVDTWTGAVRSYSRSRGVPYSPVQDILAFAGCDAQPSGEAANLARALPAAELDFAPFCRGN